MRFWRLKVWWHAYAMGKRVFYAEGKGDSGGSWHVFNVIDRCDGLQASRLWREMIQEMPGKATREMVR